MTGMLVMTTGIAVYYTVKTISNARSDVRARCDM